MWLGAWLPSVASRGFQREGGVVLTFGKMVQASNIITQSPDEGSVNTTCLKGRP